MKALIRASSGNALWFVLIAVALLGLLTAVVSRTSSSVEQTGSVEQARIKASAILRYTQSIEAAIQKMILNGTSESDLDFIAAGKEYDNTNCTKESCAVFDVAGGGIAFRTPAEILGIRDFKQNWVVSSSHRLTQAGCDDDEPECADLLLMLPDVPEKTCLQINALAGIKNPDGRAPKQSGLNLDALFTGRFEDAGALITLEEAKSTGCVYDDTNKTAVFFQLLVGR